MSLEQPLVLLAAPVLLMAVWLGLRSGRSTQLRAARIVRLWADRHGVLPVTAQRRLQGRGIAASLGVLLVVAALARPQWGTREEIELQPAREVLIALDLSRSMLAEDVPPSRLARARLLIEGLLGELKGERVGLLLFAGTAFLQSPLSADYEVMRDLLPDLEVGYLPQGGTDYRGLLEVAFEAFGQEPGADRFLIVLSDGESQGEGWRELLPRLRESGIRVIGLGLGSEAGALIPDAAGGVVKDEHGAAVLSRLESGSLRELADVSDGVYRDAASWVDLAAVVEQTVARGRLGEFVESRQQRRIERFQWLLAPGLALLLLSGWLELPVAAGARRSLRSRRRGVEATPPRRRAASVLLTGLSVAVLAAAGGAEPAVDPLLRTLAELAARPGLAAGDYAHLAEATLEHAEGTRAGGVSQGVVSDALLAVAVGEALDRSAADWPGLRSRLEVLARSEPPPPAGKPPDAPPEAGPGDPSSSAGSGGAGEPAPGGEPDPAGEGGSSRPEAGEPERGDSGEPEAGDSQEPEAGDSQEPEAGDSQEPEAGDGQEPEAGDSQEPGGESAAQQPATAPQPSQPMGEPLGDASVDTAGSEAAAEQAPSEPSREKEGRLVGGGGDELREQIEAHPELAGAFGRLQQVKEDDAPALLFRRMDAAEGRAPEPAARDW